MEERGAEEPAPGRNRGGDVDNPFAEVAEDYARYRPSYPDALFDHLAASCASTGLALECGAGSGQATVGLARRFERVVACDRSPEPLAQAPHRANVESLVAAAERTGLAPATADLVAVSQALHWFDQDAFHAEVHRVLKPRGLFAAWSYDRMRIDSALDEVVERYYVDVVGPFWPERRRHVETRYATLPFPFEELPAPELDMTADWTLPQLLGYLGTWSSTRLYARHHARDPLDEVRDDLAHAWGDPEATRTLRWPLTVRLGRL